jgi:hypothetical protein
MYLFNTLNHKSRTFLLLGASALGSLVLATPAMAEDFTITSGTTKNNGYIIDGGDTVTVTGELVTSGGNADAIYTTVGGNEVHLVSPGSISTSSNYNSGIYNSGSTNLVTASGNISTTGEWATGIKNIGSDNTTDLSGSITTEADKASGIWNQGNKNTTTVSGSITTQAYQAYGIHNQGNDNTTTVLGTITTGGSAAIINGFGVYNQGNDNTTTVSGSIISVGASAHGIYNQGNGNETTVSGSITTNEDGSYGIYNHRFETDNKTTILGTISTSGKYAYGIRTGANSETTMSGSITTSGEEAYGIWNRANSKTTVSGSITTEEEDSAGIYNNGSGSTTTLTSTGVITVRGPIADGIYNDGGQHTTIVNGSINVTGRGDDVEGDYASGVDTRGGDSQTTLGKSSRIITTGDYSLAVYAQGNNNITNMHGYISVSGNWSEGISNWGDNNINNISGSISATGTTNSNAILVYSGSGNTFTLDEGATIIGDITAMSAATNNKLTFNLGQGASYAYYVGGAGEGTGAGQWTFTDQDGHTPVATTTGASCPDSRVTVCNLVTGVSTGNLEVQDELQFSMNASLMGSLQSGSSQANNLTEAMASPQASKSNTWVNVYGASSKRASSTTQSAFDTSNAGLSIGIPMAISDRVYMDLVFNTSKTNLDIGLTKDQEITAQAYNLGAVVRDFVASDTWSVDAFGFIGRNAYDGKRKVMNNQQATGSESVTAAYSGMAVLVGVDAQFSNPINNTLSFIGGVNASLSNEKIGAYSESKYFAWDARTMTQTTGGITTGLEYHTDALTTFASLGAQRSSLRSGKTAGYTNNGTAGSYTDSATGDTYRTASIGFDYAAADGMSVTGALERLSSTSGVSGNSTSLSVNKTF